MKTKKYPIAFQFIMVWSWKSWPKRGIFFSLKIFNQFWWTQLRNSQAEEGGWSVYYPLPPGATSLFWSTLEMLLMIKTMKSGLSCSYEAICLREGEKANSGVRLVYLLRLRHIVQLMMMIMAILTNWQPLLPRHIRTCDVSSYYCLTQLKGGLISEFFYFGTNLQKKGAKSHSWVSFL